MNIRIGDIVRFISEKMEGKVTGIIDNTTVNIFVDDYGFEIPASTSDLVVIHSDFTPSKPDSSSVTQVQKGVTMESGDTLYFAIVPDNFNNLPIPAMNYFWLTIQANLSLFDRFSPWEKYSGISAGNCNPDSTCPIGTYSLKDIDAGIKAVHIQAIFFKKGSTTPRTPIEAEVKINTSIFVNPVFINIPAGLIRFASSVLWIKNICLPPKKSMRNTHSGHTREKGHNTGPDSPATKTDCR